MEELTIKADIGNINLIISNIYTPPANSCSNGYQSSIEHLLTTADTIILSDFNTHHPSWYSISTDTRGKRMDDSINGSDYGILNWDSPTIVLPNAVRFAIYLISINFPITSCFWQTLSMLGSDHLPILRLQMKTTIRFRRYGSLHLSSQYRNLARLPPYKLCPAAKGLTLAVTRCPVSTTYM